MIFWRTSSSAAFAPRSCSRCRTSASRRSATHRLLADDSAARSSSNIGIGLTLLFPYRIIPHPPTGDHAVEHRLPPSPPTNSPIATPPQVSPRRRRPPDFSPPAPPLTGAQ